MRPPPTSSLDSFEMAAWIAGLFLTPPGEFANSTMVRRARSKTPTSVPSRRGFPSASSVR
jgi:hypothetical protein